MRKWNYLRRGNLLTALAVGAVLTACAPKPKQIPRDASHEWDVLSGSVWYWSDKLKTGCTAWMASERWISVQLITNSDCSADVRHGRVRGKRVSYVDFSDELEFREYGLWSLNIRDELSVFDSQGKFLGFLPCPHEIKPEDISNMKLLSKEASIVATTNGERQIMERIEQRFENIDISALSSSQFGCTDAPLKRPAQESLRGRSE